MTRSVKLETLVHNNDWLEKTTRELKKKKVNPFVVERAFDNLPDAGKDVAVFGIEDTEMEKASFQVELERYKDNYKALDEALRKAIGEYKAKLPPLKPGELPEELNNDNAKRLLRRAINAGLLDERYQKKTENSTWAQLKVLAKYIGAACDLWNKGGWIVFERLWDYSTLKNAKWLPHDVQTSIWRLQYVVDLFSDFGLTPVPELKDYCKKPEPASNGGVYSVAYNDEGKPCCKPTDNPREIVEYDADNNPINRTYVVP